MRRLPNGLTPSQTKVLIALRRHERTFRQIAHYLGWSAPSTVAVNIYTLAEAGYITYGSCPQRVKSATATLTDRGRRASEGYALVHREDGQPLLYSFNPVENGPVPWTSASVM